MTISLSDHGCHDRGGFTKWGYYYLNGGIALLRSGPEDFTSFNKMQRDPSSLLPSATNQCILGQWGIFCPDIFV